MPDLGRASQIVLAGTTVLILAAVYVPPVAHMLRLQPLSPVEWAMAVATAAVATLWAEPMKLLGGRLRSKA